MTFMDWVKYYRAELTVFVVGSILTVVAIVSSADHTKRVDKLVELNSEIESCVWMGGDPRIVIPEDSPTEYQVDCPPRKEYVSMKDCERIESIQ